MSLNWELCSRRVFVESLTSNGLILTLVSHNTMVFNTTINCCHRGVLFPLLRLGGQELIVLELLEILKMSKSFP